LLHLCWVILILLLALMVAADASAQSLSLDRAIGAALSDNPDIHAALAAEAAARQEVGLVRGGWYPRLELQESWQRGNQPVFVFGSLLGQRRFTESGFGLDALNRPDALDNYRASVGLTQPIFDGGRMQAATRAALAGASIAEASGRQTRSDLAASVAQAYGDTLKAEAASRAAGAAVAAAIEDAARAAVRRNAGMATAADVLSLDVHLAQMRARQVTAAGDAAVARATLNRLMGVPLTVVWALEEPAASMGRDEALPALEAAALGGRPDISQASSRVEFARAGVQAAQAALRPQVAFQGGYEWNGGTWSSRAGSWAAGVSARLSLSLARTDRAAIEVAGSQLQRALAEQASTESAVRLDVRVALARLEAARARRDVAGTAVAQARESERIIRDRYEAGMATVTELLTAAHALIDAEALAVAARVDIAVASILLERASGRLQPRQEQP
jgi:outer membrane protein